MTPLLPFARLRAYLPLMKRRTRQILVLAILVALGALGWYFGLDRANDCWTQGGRWNWSGRFCRLDTLPQRAPEN